MISKSTHLSRNQKPAEDVAHEKELRSRFRRILEAFLISRSQKVTADSLRLWVDALIDLPFSNIELAIRRFNRESTEFPTPAALRKYAGVSDVLNDEERAQIAWNSVREAMRKIGAYKSVNFSDRLVNAVIREMGGWVRLCETESDSIQWKEKEFIKKYQMISRTGFGDASPLPGLEEKHNRALGIAYHEQKTIDCRLPEHDMAPRLSGHTEARNGENKLVYEVAARMKLID